MHPQAWIPIVLRHRYWTVGTPKAKAFGEAPLTKGLYRLDPAFIPSSCI